MVFRTGNKRGFTLVEVLVVVAIVALLASVVIFSLQESRKKSRDGERKADLEQIQLALRMYKNVNGTYPDCANGMQIGGAPPASGCNVNVTTALAPYFSSVPIDPLGAGIGNAYVYDSDIRCKTDDASHVIIYARQTEGTNISNWSTMCGTRNCGAVACGTDVQKATLPSTASIGPLNSSYGIILQ
jgi:type II secretion system protein G